jgi:hypothetical protein
MGELTTGGRAARRRLDVDIVHDALHEIIARHG